MKKYEIPQILSIELDPKQSVLQVCSLAGYYFEGTVCREIAPFSDGGMGNCNISIKGTTNAPTTGQQPEPGDAENQPS